MHLEWKEIKYLLFVRLYRVLDIGLLNAIISRPYYAISPFDITSHLKLTLQLEPMQLTARTCLISKEPQRFW